MSIADARRLAVQAQGLRRPRPHGVRRRDVLDLFDVLGTIQLDAINVVARTQFIVPYSRLGPYDPMLLQAMVGPGGDLFEYWAHAACLLPIDQEPLFRWRMAEHGPFGESAYRTRQRTAWRRTHARYIASVLGEVEARGPIAASQLADPRRRNGTWWDRRSLGRQALESLFTDGKLTAWRTANFERVYDLPERVLPDAVRSQPTPPIDDAQDALLLRAARALGVATASDLAYYYMIGPKRARARIAALVADGRLTEVRVEGWRDVAYTLPGVRFTRHRRDHATLLSPFDSLIWERARTSRLFGFDYTIEVYVPAAKRRYGYYVMPLLLGDELVARFDLKADRRASALLVRGSYVEPGADPDVVAPAAAAELEQLQEWLGLTKMIVSRRGNLARALTARTSRAPRSRSPAP
jgi:uncharacterized protein YcaQ